MQKDHISLHPNLVISSSKSYHGLFTKLRDSKTSSTEFVFYARRVMRILIEDTISELPSQQKTIQTPCGEYEGSELIPSISDMCAVSIVRSGDALLESIRECLPGIPIGKILIQRNEMQKDKAAKFFYSKFPPKIHEMAVIILCDPMLATGGSACVAIRQLRDNAGVDVKKIVFMNVICCPEGLQQLGKEFPDVKIVTACVDECLNEEKFIVPGLGDFGDRYFNTN